MDVCVESSSPAIYQCEQYKKLPILLKRYSLTEKMRIASIYSSKAINFIWSSHKQSDSLEVFPWLIETFVMLSLEANEYGNGDFQGKNEKKFLKMYQSIWDATDVFLEKNCGRFCYADILLPLMALTQFQLQETPWLQIYRYWWIFNNNTPPVYLKDIFVAKMGTEYEEFLLLGNALQFLFFVQAKQPTATISQKVFQYLLKTRFPTAAKNLTISRKEYVNLQKTYSRVPHDPFSYIYSLRPSVQYPLVEAGDKIYLPLPHLLIQNVTSALMYRVTDGDDRLRADIGKHLWEKYLLEIVLQSNVYDEIFSGQQYVLYGSKSQSPDVLARRGPSVLFLDSKSTVPPIGIRVADLAAHEKNISIVSKNMAQLFKQIMSFDKYNPFSDFVSDDMEDYWGIVVVLEDSYVRRNHYYKRAGEILGLDEGSYEWRWFISHIKVAPLYEIERLCLTGCNLIDALKVAADEGEDPYSYAFINYPKTSMRYQNSSFLNFKKSHSNKLRSLVEDMKDAKCF